MKATILTLMMLAATLVTASPSTASTSRNEEPSFQKNKVVAVSPKNEKSESKTVEYVNPVCKRYFADPAVLKDGDFYYAFGTGDTGDDKRFPVQKSKDLVHWEFLGGALVGLSDKAKTDYWAPEPAKKDNKYYLYYSAGNSTGLDHQLRVATATRPEGPYTDCGKLLIPSEPFSIDSHPFRDDDGRWYLYFVKDELEGDRPGTAIAVVELNDDMTSVKGLPKTILRPSADWQIFGKDREWYGRKWKEWYCIEGPYIIKRDGKYFCLYSGGCWETPRYGLAYGVSDSPLGPFEDRGIAGGACVLSGNDEFIGPGHNSLTTGPDGKTYVVYHAWDKAHTARRMCIDPLTWTEGIPKCDGPKHSGTIVLPQAH